MTNEDFREIAHSGGQVIIKVVTDKGGRRAYQQTWQHQRPVASGIFAIYALAQGVPVCGLPLGGMGSPMMPPPIPGCYMVFVGSDSEGMYGHECPQCKSYWRDESGTNFCPNCGMQGEVQDFLTTAQRFYVAQYCEKMRDALSADADGEYVIDMDAVADAAGNAAEKPPFYYAEESQQNKFKCSACGSFNDILGVFGYCSRCGTRNDLQELSEKVIPAIRERINAGGPYEACVKDSISAFDSSVGQYVSQLVRLGPMTQARRNKLENRRFHNLQAVAAELKTIFDIDVLEGLKPDDVDFAALMFHRRHVYEHKAGEADEKYIADSGDKSVRPKQALRETQESAHRIVGLVLKMAANVHRVFHEILPPEEGPIKQYQKWNPK
jgi:Zn finger protein HypA/HybF involved in hydrogenase expression